MKESRRVEAFVRRRMKMGGIDQELIAELDGGEYSLRTSDLLRMCATLEAARLLAGRVRREQTRFEPGHEVLTGLTLLEMLLDHDNVTVGEIPDDTIVDIGVEPVHPPR